jgi:hypothetical protein
LLPCASLSVPTLPRFQLRSDDMERSTLGEIAEIRKKKKECKILNGRKIHHQQLPSIVIPEITNKQIRVPGASHHLCQTSPDRHCRRCSDCQSTCRSPPRGINESTSISTIMIAEPRLSDNPTILLDYTFFLYAGVHMHTMVTCRVYPI